MASTRPRLPDFFMVGAPKCATTALTYYLGQHPEIGMCHKKDTGFLVHAEPGDLPENDGYLSLFTGFEGKRRVGDASVWCLYSERAMANISTLCADPKIIVSLRRPAEMLPSLHAQLMWNSGAPAETFEEAWRIERNGERRTSPARPPDPPGSYHAAGRYAEPVRRYVDAFGAENVLAVEFSELSRDPGAAVAGVYRFLGVDADFVPETPAVHTRHRLRLRWLRRLVYAPPPALSRPARALFSARRRAVIADRLVAINAAFNKVSERPRPIPDEVHSEMVAEFADDQERLATILRDLPAAVVSP